MSLLDFFVVPLSAKISEKTRNFLIFHTVFNRLLSFRTGILQNFPHPVQIQNFLLRDNTFSFLSPRRPNLSTDFSTPCGKLLSTDFEACHIHPVFWGQPMTFQRHFNEIYGIFPCHTNKMRFKRSFFMEFLRKILPSRPFPSSFPQSVGKPVGNIFRQDSKSP